MASVQKPSPLLMTLRIKWAPLSRWTLIRLGSHRFSVLRQEANEGNGEGESSLSHADKFTTPLPQLSEYTLRY